MMLNENKPVEHSVPKHIGLIPDGSRRWANENKFELNYVYRQTMMRIIQSIEYFFQLGVNSVSVYLASKDNFEKREPAKIESLVDALLHLIRNLLPRIVATYNVKITIAGSHLLLPAELSSAIYELCFSSNDNIGRSIYLCLGYDPLEEIKNSFKESKSPSEFYNNLWVNELVDLVIRTGGEQRLSNFLPLQSGYAELFFLDKTFPEISLDDLEQAVDSFAIRNRRFGE